MSECVKCGQPTRFIKRVLGVQRAVCAFDGGVEPHGAVGDTHVETCAAVGCAHEATTTVQSTVREKPLSVCHNHSESAVGFGAEPVFLVKPEYVEKKP